MADQVIKDTCMFSVYVPSKLVMFCLLHNSFMVDINFELFSKSEIQSSGGVEFAVKNSKIFIPYAAIREQFSSEGMLSY